MLAMAWKEVELRRALPSLEALCLHSARIASSFVTSTGILPRLSLTTRLAPRDIQSLISSMSRRRAASWMIVVPRDPLVRAEKSMHLARLEAGGIRAIVHDAAVISACHAAP